MLKLSLLIVASLFIGCGGSASVTNTASSNVNVDSQNGDTQCSYRCEPVQFEGGVGYLVTQECDGISNGPDFSPSCPSFSASAVESAAPDAPESQPDVSFENEGVL